MLTIAEFSASTESFALAGTLPAFPAVAVEVDRIAAHVPGSTMPCVWATDGDTAGFGDAIAVELGYFRIPREASIREVGNALNISHQAVSERLRRGTENLVRDMLVVEPIQDRG